MVQIHAPELPPNLPWLNTDSPLSLAALKGRIVLLDFWSYCCINCLHVLPDLQYLERKYRQQLTIIGVHSAKFDNEKAVDNVRQAILRYDIEHPVLVDSDLQVWDRYAVKAWPTMTLINPAGYVVAQVSGEGNRQKLDDLIAGLIAQLGQPDQPTHEESALEKAHLRPSLLSFPGKVLADAATNQLFIADTGHHRIIVATLTGQVQQIVGGRDSGLWDGDFDEAHFASPQGLAFDAERQWLYVADTGNHSLRKLDLVEQTVETIAGFGQKQSQIIQPHGGDARETALNSPWDLAQFRHFLLIAMAGAHQIWGLNLEDERIGAFVGTGAEACWDGDLTEAAFAQPSGLATDGKELFVADSEGSTIRAVELDNTPQVRIVCGSGDLFGFGDRDGQGEAVRLQHCMGLAYGSDHQLWIADTYNHKIKRVDTQTGICETILGDGHPAYQDGQAQQTSFYEPSGLSLAGRWLYVADTNNHAIRKVNLDTLEVTTLELFNGGQCTPDTCAPQDRAQNHAQNQTQQPTLVSRKRLRSSSRKQTKQWP
jgi:thiol-disulfide isomerase/thioredoxin